MHSPLYYDFCQTHFHLMLLYTAFTYFIYWKIGAIINQLDNQIYDLYLLVVIIQYFIKIVWACETAKNQATKIDTTIYDLFNNMSDARIKKEVIFLKVSLTKRSLSELIMALPYLTLILCVTVVAFLANNAPRKYILREGFRYGCYSSHYSE